MKNTIYLIVGPSGSGKTTVVDALCKQPDLTSISSYTTRPPRYDGETGHKFVTEKEMPSKSEMVAYTFYNGNHYWATHKDVEENDFYILDPAGIEFFKQSYRGTKSVVIINITAPKNVRFARMLNRGDSISAATERIKVDEAEFKELRPDYVIENISLTDCLLQIKKIMQ